MPHNHALILKPLRVNVPDLGVERWTMKTEQRIQILILFSREFFADLFRFKLSQ